MRLLGNIRSFHNSSLKHQFDVSKNFRMSLSMHSESKSNENTHLPQNHYNIVIAGGGMVGTTLACTLGKNRKLSNKSILLLEASKPSKWQISEKYSNRVVALNPQTINLFEKIDAWKHIQRFGSVKQLHVWDALSDSMINFNQTDGNSNVACVVENDMILKAVQEEVRNTPNITVINEAKVKKCLIQNQPNIVLLNDDSSFTCDLLLGCDGANSKVRDALDVQYLSWSYEQCGVVATLQLADAEDNFVAWQRFLPNGPIAILPLTENMSSLVWSTTPTHARALLQLPPDQFIDECNNALCSSFDESSLISGATKLVDNMLKRCNISSNTSRKVPPKVIGVVDESRALFPLGFGHAAKYVSEGVALVGDAAHKVHPLAGQGVNLGFGDVDCLNRIVGEAIYNGSNIYNLEYLARYETERQRHNVPTMLAIEGIHRLYTTQFPPFVLLRSIGLQLAEALDPLKKTIIKHASS